MKTAFPLAGDTDLLAVRFAVVLFPLLSLVGCGAKSTDPIHIDYKGPVSSLRIEGADLGGGWAGPAGLVIDDLDTPPAEAGEIGQQLSEQLGPGGVVACADFTYRASADPLNSVTVRVFVFDSKQSCDAMWKKKYEQPGAAQHYREVEGVPYRGLDSTQMTKRIVSSGNVLLSSHQVRSGDDHLDILQSYLEKLGVR